MWSLLVKLGVGVDEGGGGFRIKGMLSANITSFKLFVFPGEKNMSLGENKYYLFILK